MRRGVRHPVGLPRIHRIRRGGRLYRYHRVTRAPLPADVSETDPAFLAAWLREEAREPPRLARAPPGTLAALCDEAIRSERLAGLSPSYVRAQECHVAAIRDAYSSAPVAGLTARHVQPDPSRLPGSLGRARRKAWRLLAGVHKDAGGIDFTAGATAPRRARSKDHPPWTREEVAAFRARWPLDHPRRLAFEVVHWTGARIGDAVRLGSAMVEPGGLLTYRQDKTKADAHCPWTGPLPAFAASLEADRDALHAALAHGPGGGRSSPRCTAARARARRRACGCRRAPGWRASMGGRRMDCARRG